MPRDMEQMQLLMALSLYLNSIQNKPIVLVPATPEMLFGSGAGEEDVDDEVIEYEEDDEEMDDEEDLSSSTLENTPLDWKAGNRVTELGDDGRELLERLDLVQPV